MNASLFTVTCKEFVPSADIATLKMSINSTFTPSNTSSGYTSEESTQVSKDAKSNEKVDEQKYKTQMCANWIEKNECRYGNKCQFAHGKDELDIFKTSNKRRTKNCRTFFKDKSCMYGNRCMFRHEHRNFDQIMRHYY